MRTLLLTVLLLTCSCLQAQWRLTGIESGVMPAVGLHTYTNDSLVFYRRRNLGTASGTVQWPLAMFHFSNNSRTSWYAGIGWRTEDFAMNKYNLGDALFSILVIPFGGGVFADTLALRQVKFDVSSLTLPLAFDYNLTRNTRNSLHFHVRALLIPGMAVSRRVQLHRDETVQLANPPSDAALQLMERTYRNRIQQGSLWFAPELNITGRQLPGRPSAFFGLQPFAFDLLSTTRTYLHGGTFFKLSFGVIYHWR